jgi:hypothetical protein
MCHISSARSRGARRALKGDRRASQAKALADAGVVADAFVLLAVPDEALVDRVRGGFLRAFQKRFSVGTAKGA